MKKLYISIAILFVLCIGLTWIDVEQGKKLNDLQNDISIIQEKINKDNQSVVNISEYTLNTICDLRQATWAFIRNIDYTFLNVGVEIQLPYQIEGEIFASGTEYESMCGKLD